MAITIHCTPPLSLTPALLLLGLGVELDVVAAFTGPSTPPCTFAGATEFPTLAAAAWYWESVVEPSVLYWKH